MARERVRPNAVRYGYRLTLKGEPLLPVLVGLMEWRDAYVSDCNGPLCILDPEQCEPIRTIAAES